MVSSLVSVILPAYNAAAFLARTLSSVLTQTYDCWELIIVDDGSQDETGQIAQGFAQTDRRIKFLQQPNAGVAAARNRAIAAAQGEWIAPIDADDLWYPDYLAQLVKCFEQAPAQVGVVYTWSEDIDADDRPTGGVRAARITGNIYRTLLCHYFLGNASSTMIRRDYLLQVGGYDSSLRSQQAQGCEDWDLYLRLAACYEFSVVPQVLVGYRCLTNSMSADGQAMGRSQALMLQRVQSKSPEIPTWYYGLSRSSFCLYLAHQAARQSNGGTGNGGTSNGGTSNGGGGGEAQRQSRHWLRQAQQAHYWATMLRPDWYILSLRLTCQLLFSSRRSTQPVQPTKPVRPTQPRHRTQPRQPIQPKIWFKVWVTDGLHRWLSRGQPSPLRRLPHQN